MTDHVFSPHFGDRYFRLIRHVIRHDPSPAL
nr:MAG TPA: hypothetical protein [Caudoviricetes sp.]